MEACSAVFPFGVQITEGLTSAAQLTAMITPDARGPLMGDRTARNCKELYGLASVGYAAHLISKK
jgi:hypothetical protein